MAQMRIDPDRDVLLVVDIQNDFCPSGALVVPEGDAVVPVVNRLSASFPQTILTQDWHSPGHLSFASAHPGRAPFDTVSMPYGPQILWPDHCVRGTHGADFHPGLTVPHAELVLRKGYRKHIDSYSAFFENDRRTATGLCGYLRERRLDRLFICGLALDFCVSWSAVDARRLGFEVTVIENACRPIDTGGSLAKAMADMNAAGVRVVADDALRLSA